MPLNLFHLYNHKSFTYAHTKPQPFTIRLQSWGQVYWLNLTTLSFNINDLRRLNKKKGSEVEEGEEEEESNSMTSTQSTQGETYIVQHTREHIYNQKKEWASA